MLMRNFNLSLSVLVFLVQGSLSCSISSLFIGEIEAIDQAISASEKRLDAQRQIKNLIIELGRLEDGVVKAENPKSQASRMVVQAEKILTMIQNEHLESLFSSAYLEELRFYSSFARKTHLDPQ